jgi:hypothetical protein
VVHANRVLIASFMVLAGGCGGGSAAPLDTGLTGVVLRGPVEPVCQEGVPCDAPFAATFAVRQGGRVVRAFSSSADGRFTVMLAPGAYQVVPGADAPIIAPSTQVRDVVVGASGLTTDTLLFDTGIR